MRALGICFGSANLSWVLLKEGDNGLSIEKKGHILHQGRPREVISATFQDLKLVDYIAVTGRKFRQLISLASISEPEATELALDFINHQNFRFNAIVSAGAEVFTAYILNEENQIVDVKTGNKCASGTGEFFLQQLRRMNISLQEAVELASQSSSSYKVSGRCSVFCKSDSTHALNRGESKARVIRGLCEMLAFKILELLGNVPKERVVLLGGVSRNPVVVGMLKEHIKELFVPKEAIYFEALGVALWQAKHKIKASSQEELFKERRIAFEFLPRLSSSIPWVDFKPDTLTKPIEKADTCVLGLDVGSTTTKAVLLRMRDDALISSVYLRTDGDPIEASRNCYKKLYEATKENDLRVIGLGVTGSGRYISSLHAKTVGIINEIIAHARGALFFDREVETIFEIGGQDAKYISISNGVPCDYAMNEACSAGTGSFLEEASQEALGIDVKEIADIALKADLPCNFSDQCAAFISSDIKSAIQQGLVKEDIIAGLVYSICMNYLNRVKGQRPVGKKVFMQGGVCYNKSVAVAMAHLVEKPIIVPPHPGLMGAFGTALEIKDRMKNGLLEPQDFNLKVLAEREVTYHKSFRCKGANQDCDRNCEIALIEVEKKKFPFGGACNRYYNRAKRVYFELEDLNLVKKRQQLLWEVSEKSLKTTSETSDYGDSKKITEIFSTIKQSKEDSHKTVGINKTFLVHSFYPLFYNFFTQLGMKVILSENILEEGLQKKSGSFCYPAEVSCGLFLDLLKKRPDYIFLPQISRLKSTYTQESQFTPLETKCTKTNLWSPNPVRNKTPEASVLPSAKISNWAKGDLSLTGFTCMMVEAENFYLKSIFKDIKDKRQILSPLIDFSKGLFAAKTVFVELAYSLGFNKRKASWAYELACKKQEEFEQKTKELGRKVLLELKGCSQNLAIVLFGRPYNAFVEEVNMAIPHKFASRGVVVLSYDCLPYENQPLDPDMYWACGQNILRAAKFVKNHPQLFACYITNFACGPDSFLLGYFQDIMGKKPSLILELDSHTADVGINTRIEAFLDIIKNFRHLVPSTPRKEALPWDRVPREQVPQDEVGARQLKEAFIGEDILEFNPCQVVKVKRSHQVISSQGQRFKLTSSSVKILIPAMGKLGPQALACVFRGFGINSEVLPLSNPKTLKCGRQNTNCKECLPLILIVGGLLNYLKSNPNSSSVYVYFLPTGTGNCRFGQYKVFLKNLIEKKKLKNLALFSLRNEDSYLGLGFNFRRKALEALVISDVMLDIKNALGCLAKDKDLAEGVFKKEWFKMMEYLEGKQNLSLKKRLKETALILKEIPLKMPLSQAKRILLTGEIYVRHEDFVTDFLIEYLAKRGFIVKITPVMEWIYYIDHLIKEGIIGEKRVNIMTGLDFIIKNYFLKRYEYRIKSILAHSGLYELEMLDINSIIRTGENIVNLEFTGEPILVIGSSILEILDRVSGVISIGPFGCLPTRINEAILNQEFSLETKMNLDRSHKIGTRFRSCTILSLWRSLRSLSPFKRGACTPLNNTPVVSEQQRFSFRYNKHSFWQRSTPLETTKKLPFLSIEIDSNKFSPLMEARLETFLLQAERTHQKMRVPGIFK